MEKTVELPNCQVELVIVITTNIRVFVVGHAGKGVESKPLTAFIHPVIRHFLFATNQTATQVTFSGAALPRRLVSLGLGVQFCVLGLGPGSWEVDFQA